MKHVCYTCDQKFSTPFNLRRHIERSHACDDSLNPYTKRKPLYQRGGGGDVEDDDTISTDTEVSSDVDESIDVDESDTESDDGEYRGYSGDEEEDDTDENWVFDRLMQFTPEEERKWTLQEKREEFRSNYSKFLEWYSHLKKNAIHRKVMATVKDLESDIGEYDRQEALHLAVEKRRFLLDRLVDNDLDEQDQEDHEGQKEEEDTTLPSTYIPA